MGDNSSEWILSLRALIATRPYPVFTTPATIGLRVDGSTYCFDTSGREVSTQSVNCWLMGSKELFIQLSQGVITPQEAFIGGRLQLRGEPELLCGVSLLFERLSVL
jgi:hypothetical protein